MWLLAPFLCPLAFYRFLVFFVLLRRLTVLLLYREPPLLRGGGLGLLLELNWRIRVVVLRRFLANVVVMGSSSHGRPPSSSSKPARTRFMFSFRFNAAACFSATISILAFCCSGVSVFRLRAAPRLALILSSRIRAVSALRFAVTWAAAASLVARHCLQVCFSQQ